MDPRDIAVVGIACRWPGIIDLADFWRHLVKGIKVEKSIEDEDVGRHTASISDGGDVAEGETHLLAQTVTAVLKDADVGLEDDVLRHADLIVMRGISSHLPLTAMPSSPVDPALWIGGHFELMGDCRTLDGSRISLCSAIEVAACRLRQDFCDAVLLVYVSSNNQGASAIFLKRKEYAESHGDRIYALLSVPARSAEPDLKVSSVVAHQNFRQSMQEICEGVEFDPQSIGYLELGRASSKPEMMVDKIKALKNFLGLPMEHLPLSPSGSAADLWEVPGLYTPMASLIKSILCVSNKIVPPGLLNDTLPAQLEGTPFYVNREVLPWIDSSLHPRRAAFCEYTPDGYCTCLIAENTSSRGRAREIYTGIDPETELVVLTADLLAGLRHKVQALNHFLEISPRAGSLADIAYTLINHVCDADPFRLALVCSDLHQLKDYLNVCYERLEDSDPYFDDLNDIYLTSKGNEHLGKVLCIFPGLTFPGLAGNYLDHLRELCIYFPRVREIFDKFSNRPGKFRESLPLNHYFFPAEYLSEEGRKQLRQSLEIPKIDKDLTRHWPLNFCLPSYATALADWAMWALIKDLSVPVDMLFGHSIGEFVALCAAGAMDFESIAEGYWELYDYWKQSQDESCLANAGRLALVYCDENLLKPVFDLFDGVTTAIHISPNMRILGGEEGQIQDAVNYLQQEGILSEVLPYPAVHTPYSSSLSLLWRPILEKIPLRHPMIPVYSAALQEVFPEDPSAIGKILQKIVDYPLHLWQTTQKFYGDGARIFIQLGGGDNLYSQANATLGVDDVVNISTEVEFRSAVTQINHFCAALLTSGIKADLKCLFRNRFPKKLSYDRIMGKEDDLVASSTVLKSGSRPKTVVPHSGDPFPRDIPAQDTALSNEKRMPFVGSLLDRRPGEVRVEYLVDINEDIYLKDHVFVHAPFIKPAGACIPVLPLAVGVEMMAETAACLVPGSGLIGIEDLKALRWIRLEDVETLRLQISARLEHYDPDWLTSRVHVEIFEDGVKSPCVTSTVVMGRQYLLSLQMEFEELLDPHPSRMTTDLVYKERYLFHGPVFHCVVGELILGDQGLVGELMVLPKEYFFQSLQIPEILIHPGVMDGIAQLVSLWAMDQQMYVFPIGIGKLEIYRIPPPEGSRLPVRAQVARLSDRRLQADIEVQDGDGAVWMRLKGCRYWIYHWSERVRNFRRFPERYILCTPMDFSFLPPGAVCMDIQRSDLGDFDIFIMARHFLHLAEMKSFQKLAANPVRQRQWLLGRIAAKDAVRQWLTREHGLKMLHPAAFTIESDERGRPFILPVSGISSLPHLSITHASDRALAVAHKEEVGIDIERISSRDPRFLECIASSEEQRLLDVITGERRDEWITRLWCAKEAMAKLTGTGFNGAPHKWRAVRIFDDESILISNGIDGPAGIVNTSRVSDFTVALAAGNSGINHQDSPGNMVFHIAGNE